MEYKLAVIGGGAVGKSAVTVQYTQNHFVEMYDPTIEDAYRKQVIINGDVCLLDILDTAGQDEYCCLRDAYMRTGRGFILVYSITCRSSFEEVKKLHEEILRAKDKSKVPLVVIGNKCDLEELREVTTLEGKQLAESFGAQFLETSAKSGVNIEETFAGVVNAIQRDDEINNPIKKKSQKKKKECSIL
eukprot:TRINITY_DN446_c0_g1_i1.p1 TRINITY_DN446_c0_g1~~TRINITY_DN446_c0_g1_i1.p1  ORF type:complete len:188 (+),score=73.48 TRINITY_DN446_c0_g1_i1:143-706(+)